MVGTSWATARQDALLRERLPQYREIFRTHKNYNDFWASLRHEWQKEENWSDARRLFPDTPQANLDAIQRMELQHAIRATDERIQTWFRWRVNPASRLGGKRGTAVKLEGTPKTRFRSHQEMYSKIYYNERIKPTVNERLAGMGKISRATRMTTIKEITTECWEKENDEIKAIVIAKCAAQVAPALDDNEDTPRTPQQYLEAIKSLPNTLANYLRVLAIRTGYAFSLAMGGPDPKSPTGAIRVSSLHLGQTSIGTDFGHALPDYDKVLMPAYTEFLEEIFPPHVRASRVLGADDLIQMDEGTSAMDNSEGFSAMDMTINTPNSTPSSASGSVASALVPSQPLSKLDSVANSSPPVPAASPSVGSSLTAASISMPTGNSKSLTGTMLPHFDTSASQSSSDAMVVDTSGPTTTPPFSVADSEASAVVVSPTQPLGIMDTSSYPNGHDIPTDSLSNVTPQLAQRLQIANENEWGLLNVNQDILTDISNDMSGFLRGGSVLDQVPPYLPEDFTSRFPKLRLQDDVLQRSRAFDHDPHAADHQPLSSGFQGRSNVSEDFMYGHCHTADTGVGVRGYENLFTSATLPIMSMSDPSGPIFSDSNPSFSAPSFQSGYISQSTPFMPSPQASLVPSLPSGETHTPSTGNAAVCSPPPTRVLAVAGDAQVALPLLPHIPAASDASSLHPLAPRDSLPPQIAIAGDASASHVLAASDPQQITAADDASAPVVPVPTHGAAATSDGSVLSTSSTPGFLNKLQSITGTIVEPTSPTPQLSGLTHASSNPTHPPVLVGASTSTSVEAAPVSCSGTDQKQKRGRKALAPVSLNPESTCRSACATILTPKAQSAKDDTANLVPSTSLPLVLPPTELEPPPWFHDARTFFLSKDFGKNWCSLVESWGNLEKYLGYGTVVGTKTALPQTSLRPEEWLKWTKTQHRSYLRLPAIPDSADLGKAIMGWWYAMQPSARKSKDPAVLLPNYALSALDWEPLCRAGVNGVASIMTVMTWWAVGLSTRTQWQDDTSAQWELHVKDIGAVFDAMVEVKAGKDRTVKGTKGKENSRPTPLPTAM